MNTKQKSVQLISVAAKISGQTSQTFRRVSHFGTKQMTDLLMFSYDLLVFRYLLFHPTLQTGKEARHQCPTNLQLSCFD